MSEGRSSNQSWVRKLSNLFLEPQDQEQLIELLRSASERHILDSEALSIVEGGAKRLTDASEGYYDSALTGGCGVS